MKALNIVSSAYRATSEEQDDTVVWFVHTLRNAGADVEILLRGNSVNYAVAEQRADPMALGAVVQKNPPRPAEDLARFMEQGGRVFAVSDDLAARGIDATELVAGVRLVGRAALAALYDRYDRVWAW